MQFHPSNDEYQNLLISYQQLYEHNQKLLESINIRDTEGNSYTPNDLIQYLEKANTQINDLKTRNALLEKEIKLYKSFQNLINIEPKSIQTELPGEISSQSPLYFRCALTNQLMIDPVIDKDGYSYDREAIKEWLQLSKISPMTSQPLSVEDLRSNFALKSAIKEWVKQKKCEENITCDDSDEEEIIEEGPINTEGNALVHLECNDNVSALKNFISFDGSGIDLSDIKWKAKIKDEIHRDIINIVHTHSGLPQRIKKFSPTINKRALDYLEQVGVIVKEMFAHMIQKQSIISVYQKLRKCFVIFCKIPEQKPNCPKDRIFTMIKLYTDFLLTEAIKKMTFEKKSHPLNFTQVIDKARNQLLEMAIDEKTNSPRNAEVTIVGCDIPMRLILIVNGVNYVPPKKAIFK